MKVNILTERHSAAWRECDACERPRSNKRGLTRLAITNRVGDVEVVVARVALCRPCLRNANKQGRGVQ